MPNRPVGAVIGFAMVAVATAGSVGAEPSLQRPLPQHVLLALSKVDHALVIVDPASLVILDRVPVGPDPHEVVASPDGRTAYVSNTGYGSLHEIDVVDLPTRKALPAIDTTPLNGPHGLAFVGEKLWFTAQGAKSVGRYDPKTGHFDWAIGTGQDTTHMIHVSPDGKRLFTTNVDSGTVSVLEQRLREPTIPPTGVLPPSAKPRLNWVQTLIPVGKGAEGFDVSPDERELWTATPTGSLVIVDLDHKEVVASIDTGVPGLHRVSFTPDGRQVLVTSVRTGALLIYDVRTRQEVKRLTVGRGAAILVDPATRRAFVSCTPDHYIAVIDLDSLEPVGRLQVGDRPDGLALAAIP